MDNGQSKIKIKIKIEIKNIYSVTLYLNSYEESYERT